MFIYVVVVALASLPTFGRAQEGFLPQKEIFKRMDVKLKGRLRHLTVESIRFAESKDIAVLERSGKYPNWMTNLSVWGVSSSKKIKELESLQLPTDAVYYGFVSATSNVSAMLVLVCTDRVEVIPWREGHWMRERKLTHALTTIFSQAAVGDVDPIQVTFQSELDVPEILLPTLAGIQRYQILKDKLKLVATYAAPIRSFYNTFVNSEPFALPFWVRGSIWYPKSIFGSLTGSDKQIFWPWMDEVNYANSKGDAFLHRVSFNQLTEFERDDNRTMSSWTLKISTVMGEPIFL